jgi:putative endonuclease
MQEVVGSTPILSTKSYPAPAGFFVMSFYVYILYSSSLDKYYIGHTENLSDRLFRHTNSGSKSTKKANDWVIYYTEEFESRQDAVRRELDIKNKKSRKYIEWLIKAVG